ncbi:MAG TPA: hypothetical protein VE153_36605 [Myxococcus sp.]|nr:hypothetical protein [Myxococcus sp.]
MGKTTTLLQERPAFEQQCAGTGAEVIWENLDAIGSEERLVRVLFENDTVSRWRQGSHHRFLILDSFDECHLRIDTLANLLLDMLRRQPRERLSIAIACRPAAWPGLLEDGLNQLWPEKGLSAFDLAPLRQRDVREAARLHGLDADAFVQEVAHRQVTPLAIRPVTLRMLLGAFEDGALPSERWELYARGCRQLAQEQNRSRRESPRLRSATAVEERLRVAARIAGQTLLAGRDSLWLDAHEEPPRFSTSPEELEGGEEPLPGGRRLEVTRGLIREVLDSGLFGTVGEARFVTWAHRTYAEYLTALWLCEHEVPVPKLAALLRNPADEDFRVVPQLLEVAAWLASRRKDFRDFLLEKEPWVLLRSDALAVDTGLRARLVEALLEAVRRGTVLAKDFDGSRVRVLAHPRLADQLRGALRESDAPDRVRVLALTLAQACDVRALAPDCTGFVLDTAWPLERRLQALDLVEAWAAEAASERLVPLALSPTGTGEDSLLRCRILRLLWPGAISTSQLLKALDAMDGGRPSEGVSLLHGALAERLPAADMPLALRWAGQRKPRPIGDGGLLPLLLRRAWAKLDAPGVLDAFCVFLTDLLHRKLSTPYRTPVRFGWDWSSREDGHRWRVIDGLLAHGQDRFQVLMLQWIEPRILLERDAPELLRRADQAPSAETTVDWRTLAEWCRTPVETPEASDPLHNGEVEKLVRAEEQSLEQLPADCEALLHRLETQNPGAWSELVYRLFWPGIQLLGQCSPDLTHARTWKVLPSGTHDRIARAATRFLTDYRPQSEPWLDGAQLDWHARCAYEAFMLLAARGPEAVEALPDRVWREWTSLVLAAPVWGTDEGQVRRKRLVSRATERTPVEVRRSFRRLLAVEHPFDRAFHFLRSLKECWNEVLLNEARQLALNPTTGPSLFSSLLEVLVAHGEQEGLRYADSLLSMRDTPSWQSRRVIAAATLLSHSRDDVWPRLWPLLRDEVDFGREVFKSTAFFRPLLERLTPAALTELYRWLERPLATAESSPTRQVNGERLHYIRDAILDRLLLLTSNEALEAAKQLSLALPEDEAVRGAFLNMQAMRRMYTWRPPSPQEVLALVGLERARMVRSPDELLEVVLESLGRIQAELHDETPAIHDLWNKDPKGHLSPKEEVRLSDWLKRHLQKDLAGRRVVVNREVEIRPSEPSRPGQRTDLRVDAIAHLPGGADEQVSLLIEVKGAWNRGLWTSMREQLVERYLAENRCRHGIYLVGWYGGERKVQPHPDGHPVDLRRLRDDLDEQARAVSRAGVQVRAFVLDAAFRTGMATP